MREASDPFTIAKQLLGDVRLTAGQLAQLRALNTKYFSALYALEHGDSEKRAASEKELATLRRAIESDIRDMLTPEQRATLDGGRGPT